MRLTWLACTVLLTAAAHNGCRNECDFFERCQGNLRQVCGGVDQWVGRTVSEEPCVAPNEACVTEAHSALCVRAPVTRCEPSFVDRCEGSVWIHCSFNPSGYLLAEDCAALRRTDGTNAGLVCGLGASGVAQCVSAP